MFLVVLVGLSVCLSHYLNSNERAKDQSIICFRNDPDYDQNPGSGMRAGILSYNFQGASLLHLFAFTYCFYIIMYFCQIGS